jgi:signal transduction histidine kinase
LCSRFSFSAFAVLCVHAVALSELTNYEPLLPVCVSLATLTARCSSRKALLSLLIALAPAAAWVDYNRRTSDQPMDVRVISLVALAHLFILLLAAGIGRWQWTARVLRETSEREAVALERLRLARELHDIVAHTITLMVLQAAGARSVMPSDPRRANAALVLVEDVGKQAMGELRALLGVLRGGGSTTGEQPTPAAPVTVTNDIETLLETFRAVGLMSRLHVTGSPGKTSPDVGLASYRIVQEALTNVTKHAGANASVNVWLTWGEQTLTIVVEDDGVERGSLVEWPSSGIGLVGLTERAVTAGGNLTAGPTPAGGFRVVATLPLVCVPESVMRPTVVSHASPGVSPVTVTALSKPESSRQ